MQIEMAPQTLQFSIRLKEQKPKEGSSLLPIYNLFKERAIHALLVEDIQNYLGKPMKLGKAQKNVHSKSIKHDLEN